MHLRKLLAIAWQKMKWFVVKIKQPTVNEKSEVRTMNLEGSGLELKTIRSKIFCPSTWTLCELTIWGGRILMKPFRWPPRTTCTRPHLQAFVTDRQKAFILPFSSRGWRWWARYIIRLSFSSALKIPAWLFFRHIGLRCMCLSQYVG